MSIDRILAAAAGQPWALMPEKMAEIRAFLELRGDGVRFSAAEIEARIGPGRTGQSAQPATGIAVLSVFGVLSQRANLMGDISSGGGTSTERVGASLRAAVADPNVRAIVLEVDSPGGGTHGIRELAEEVFRARGRKPIVAQVNSTAASAAYWVATAASEVVVTPGGQVGSIGVYGMHEDVSALLEKTGIRKTFISAGEYKTEGNSLGPLSDDARAYMQRQVNEVYGDFVGDVARGRGTTPSRVKAEFGKGRMVLAREAVRLGMADRIGTMQDTLRRLGAANATAMPGQSAASMDALSATADEERDEFRRRRHAFRVRTAGGDLDPRHQRLRDRIRDGRV